ncbi:hypothetical protein FPV67DRAFT_1675336 [Lyophyllum atratum]|nr:hypothetical protein FPV67DRAFT_1675336 [Lyophyllum atratum]
MFLLPGAARQPSVVLAEDCELSPAKQPVRPFVQACDSVGDTYRATGYCETRWSSHPPPPTNMPTPTGSESMNMAVVALAINDVDLGVERHPRNEVFDFVLRDNGRAVPVNVEVTSSLTAQVFVETAFVSNIATLNIRSALGTVVHVVDLQSHGVCVDVQNTLRSLKVVARLFPVG